MKETYTQILMIALAALLFLNCMTAFESDFGKLLFKAKLSKDLEEVSGIQYTANEDAFWMINDSGNASKVYLVKESGKILRVLKVDEKNKDWEDITMDIEGNLYVGDFGNNDNERDDLRILKIHKKDLDSEKKVEAEKIKFSFPEQKKFPPKKKYFDVESLFEWKGNLYVFTKSRVKNEVGRTFLYRIPNEKGTHKAQLISDFITCPDEHCWITSADISRDGKKVVLLNHKSAWVFTDFQGDDFFSGKAKEFSFGHLSQKEAISFENDSILFITDEENRHGGRNLYEFHLN